ncbi:general transcription factor IIH subunit 3-like isoform X1 [Drosophila obscura]|uniref:general transcription factor IIH subunit 3-like isoform X1 n=1 Tax=Drosophila obscura TaxID=7282 RepID=UPI001BB1BD09|nr:general transcription factor IIH subunit 3-like isoform X1 [Drosophila obscura]
MEAEPLTNLDVATTPMASSKIETQNESNIEKTEADADAVSLNAMDDNRRFFKMHTGDLAPEDVHILVLILDIDYGQSYIQSGKVDMALNMVDAAMVLANGHLLQRPRNEVGVIACSRNIVMLAHSIDIPLTSYDYQLDTIKTMEYDVSRKVEEELLREFAIVEKLSEEDDKSSLIAESLGLALAYIQKRRRQIPDIYTGRRVQGRILHPSYDNLILEALETNVTINVCAIKVEKQKPLQRATEVTDGLYLCTNETFSLPGSLVDHYLYPSYLVKAPKPHITTPARCACHGFDNKIGFVCAKCNLARPKRPRALARSSARTATRLALSSGPKRSPSLCCTPWSRISPGAYSRMIRKFPSDDAFTRLCASPMPQMPIYIWPCVASSEPKHTSQYTANTPIQHYIHYTTLLHCSCVCVCKPTNSVHFGAKLSAEKVSSIALNLLALANTDRPVAGHCDCPSQDTIQKII